MTTQRILAIGDIHGCHEKLEKMLNTLSWNPNNGDLLVFLGDYIDRGPHSYEVISTLTALIAQHPKNVLPLMGNHEKMFLDFISGLRIPHAYGDGVANTVRSFAARDHALTTGHLRFLRNLHLYHETSDYIFVHAGLRPGVSISQQTPEDMLWIRDEFLNSDYDFGKTVVFGHTPFQEPFVSRNRIGIDTGAVFGGALTAVILPERQFVTID
ncbi:MAG: metallophosphoesterase family protein [Candidatus Adiutrix sp.]